MTKQEAIRLLQAAEQYTCMLPSEFWQKKEDGGIDKALEMAIAALAEPEIVRCGECKFAEYDATARGVRRGCVLNSAEGNRVQLYHCDFCSRGRCEEE